MSDTSANLSLPYLQPSQAQKHVTHNEALLLLDALVQLTVLSATTQDAPGDPQTGHRYILPMGASGAWSGRDKELALWDGTAWMFLTPRLGWTAWVADSDTVLRFDGSDWTAEASDLQNVPLVGVNAAADTTNRLTVAAEASLLTHAGAGHQVKINKASAGDTASLLFQSGWSGRAEMGIIGSDEFVFKVSPDGAAFHTAISTEAATGSVSFPNGVTGLSPSDMGDGPLTPRAYVIARGGELFTNGTGGLGTGYNYPASFARDPVTTPDLSAAFVHSGYDSGLVTMTETIPVNPREVYALSCLLRQESRAGDWSGFANGERHQQRFGVICLDADGLMIAPMHHARVKSGGVDSLTSLAAPLSPGDTQISVTDASGWNDATADTDLLGVAIYGYRDSHGRSYADYTRFAATGLFQTAGVNKTTHVITLDAPLAASLGNPDDGGGTWPIGTAIGNCASGLAVKPVLDAGVLPAVDTWYKTSGHIGGIDRSATNVAQNFAPGTVGMQLVWQANLSNVSGGAAGFPDTGAGHHLWVAGASARCEPLARMQAIVAGAMAGAQEVFVPVPSIATGEVQMVSALSDLSPW